MKIGLDCETRTPGRHSLLFDFEVAALIENGRQRTNNEDCFG